MMLKSQKRNVGKALLGMFSMIGFAAGGTARVNPLEEEVERMISENFSQRKRKDHNFSVSDEDIIKVIETKLSENYNATLGNISIAKDRDVKNLIALNTLDTGHFSSDILKNNKLETGYENFVDYQGITSYSILERGEFIKENLKIDEFSESVKNRIDQDVSGYKNYEIELGIESELEYEHNKERAIKSEEWISPFKSFKSEI